MATARTNDLQAFKSFVDEYLTNGESAMTLDEALARWEYENASEEEREETLETIRRGIDDMNAGQTVDAFDFVQRMRRKFQATSEP